MSPTRGDRAARLALGLGALASVLGAPTVSAHEGDATVISVLDRVEPPLPAGVVVQVRRSIADQVVVENPTGQVLEVLADTGEAFLRIGPGGVQADLGSPSWYATSSPLGVLGPNAPRQPVTPRLVTVARDPAWGWFDHRLHPSTPVLSAQVRRGRRPVRLGEWTVPLRYAGRTVSLRGHVEYRPFVGALRSRLTRPLNPGLTMQVLDGRVPGLFARYEGPGALVVTGRAGEPFARLSAGGAEVNTWSATYAEDQLLRGSAPTSAPDARAAPRWRRLSAQPTLAWLDQRLAYAPGQPPANVQARDTPTTLVRWRVPVLLDGVPVDVEGVTEWVPIAAASDASGSGGRGVGWVLAGVLAAVGALLSGVALVRGRAARPAPIP